MDPSLSPFRQQQPTPRRTLPNVAKPCRPQEFSRNPFSCSSYAQSAAQPETSSPRSTFSNVHCDHSSSGPLSSDATSIPPSTSPSKRAKKPNTFEFDSSDTHHLPESRKNNAFSPVSTLYSDDFAAHASKQGVDRDVPDPDRNPAHGTPAKTSKAKIRVGPGLKPARVELRKSSGTKGGQATLQFGPPPAPKPVAEPVSAAQEALPRLAIGAQSWPRDSTRIAQTQPQAADDLRFFSQAYDELHSEDNAGIATNEHSAEFDQPWPPPLRPGLPAEFTVYEDNVSNPAATRPTTCHDSETALADTQGGEHGFLEQYREPWVQPYPRQQEEGDPFAFEIWRDPTPSPPPPQQMVHEHQYMAELQETHPFPLMHNGLQRYYETKEIPEHRGKSRGPLQQL